MRGRKAELVEQVARIRDLDLRLLDRVSREALSLDRNWTVEYERWQSGNWQTVSLYNDSGDPGDVTIRDCAARETTVMEHLPATRELLDSFGLKYMWVRIARLPANTFLWEHSDYRDLADLERHRLHIPLHTNRSATLTLGGARVHLGYGSIWRLVPTNRHGACNFSGPDRLHIIMDCYADDAFRDLTSNLTLDDNDIQWLPEATDGEIAAHLDEAVTLGKLGYHQAAEHLLLKLFYHYSMPEGMGYDLVIRAYEMMGEDARAAEWRLEKKVKLCLA